MLKEGGDHLSAFRNFGISFLAALLIFGGVAYYAMGIVSTLFDKRRAEGDEQAWQDAEIWEDPALNTAMTPLKTGRSFNMVIIGIDDYSDEKPFYGSGDQLLLPQRAKATTILFVRFDKESRSIVMSNIPESTLVTMDYVTMTLGQAYGYRGAEYIKEKVSALTGMTVDFSFVLSGKEFANYALTNTIDKRITVPFDLTTTAKDGLPSKTFTKGQVLSNANDIYTLLHHNDYPLEQINLRYTLIRDIFLQMVRKFAVTNNPDGYYTQFIADLNTNMTKADVTLLIEVLATLPAYIDMPEDTTTLTVIDFYKNGFFAQDGSFTVDMAASRKAFEEYKK